MVSQAALELLVTMKDEASSGFGSLGGVLKTVGGIAGGVALAGVAAFGAAVVSGVGDAREAAGLLAQTNAVIKSTGEAAGVTAGDVTDLATALSDASGKSLFGDDQIQASENLLLTFTNLKKGTLEAATAISVDMAQALGGAPKDSAIQLGKALNDPIAGITALSRVGVTFTKQQKDQIKAMQQAGDMAGAQGVILAELNKEFGGSAQAAADATGGWSEFTGRLGEVKEALGAAVLPLLNSLVGMLLDRVMPALETGAAIFSGFIGAIGDAISGADPLFGELGEVIFRLATAFGLSKDAAAEIEQAFFSLTDALGPFVEAIAFLIDDFVNIGPLSSEFGESLGGIAQALGLPLPLVDLLEKGIFALQDVFAGLMATFTDSSTPVEGLLNVLSQVSPTFAIIRTTVETALPVVQQIVEQVFGFIQTFIDQNGADIIASVRQAWGLIQDIIATISPLISGIVLALTIVIRDFLTAHGTEITAILNNAWTIIKNVVLGALEIIKGLLQAALAIFRGDWEGAWTAIQTMSVSVTKRIWEIIKAALDLIANFFGTSLEGIKQTWIGNWNALVEIVGKIDWMALGISVIDGITGGLLSKAASLAAAAVKVVSDAWEAGKKAIGMGSPAKKWMPIGQSMVEGIAVGIAGSSDIAQDAINDMFRDMSRLLATGDFQAGMFGGLAEDSPFVTSIFDALRHSAFRAGAGPFGGLMEDDPLITQLFDSLSSLNTPPIGGSQTFPSGTSLPGNQVFPVGASIDVTISIADRGLGWLDNLIDVRADAVVRRALDRTGDRALSRFRTGG